MFSPFVPSRIEQEITTIFYLTFADNFRLRNGAIRLKFLNTETLTN